MSYKVGAFNVQAFSLRKLADPHVQPHILKLIKSYDIILLQEVRDNTGDMVNALLQLLAGNDPQLKVAPRKEKGPKKEAGGDDDDDDDDSGARDTKTTPKTKVKAAPAPAKVTTPAKPRARQAKTLKQRITTFKRQRSYNTRSKQRKRAEHRLWFSSLLHLGKKDISPKKLVRKTTTPSKSLSFSRRMLKRLQLLRKSTAQGYTTRVANQGNADQAVPVNVDPSLPYNAVISPPLGRTTHKERYLFLYKTKLFEPVATYLYKDNRTDVFEREPFAVRFRSNKALGNKDICLIGLHTQPDRAKEELAHAHLVMHELRKMWAPGGGVRGVASKNPLSSAFWKELIVKEFPILACFCPTTTNLSGGGGKVVIGPILMGDFNAGKNYVPLKYRPENPLFTDEDLVWGLGDERDTTVRGTTEQAYDRMVWWQKDVPYMGKVNVRDYSGELGLAEKACLKVSDHWPIDVVIKLHN
jgi:hypothetical protein